MKNPLIVIIMCLVWGSIPCITCSQGSNLSGKLIYEGTVTDDDLRSVVCISVSTDLKHLYSASFASGIVNVFDRDLNTGHIAPKKSSISSLTDMAGAISVRLSDDQKFAAVTSIYSGTLILLQRDPVSGKLNRLDVARKNLTGTTGLSYPIDAVFSPDNRFIYTIDGSTRSDNGNVTAFKITDENKLNWIETNSGTDKCFNAARGIAIHPKGKTLYVACSNANTLVVLSRDKKTGKAEVRQIIKDEVGGVHSLAGAFGVTISPDNRFLYTTSGRFKGDNAVTVFKIKSGYKLELIQELWSGEKGLGMFSGGNEIVVSPDGRNVYVSGTTSNTIVNLSRDTKTGKLIYNETIDKNTTGPAGITLSPDGNFLYVAQEAQNAISIFRRVTK